VRDVVPTYSKIPKIVQDLVKKQPYTAPYISWTSEIIRTTWNTFKHGYKDATSGNPVLQKSGIVRLLSAGFVQTMLLTATDMIRDMIFGLDEEDELALRRFLPDWQVNALLLLTGKKDGKVSFWDFSYLNPYDVVTEPFIAMSNEADQGGNIWDVAAVGVEKAMSPWTGEQLLAGAVMDVARGYTKEGIPLYNQADSALNNTMTGAWRLFDAVKPGAFNLTSRLYKALKGEVSRGGKVYNFRDELSGALLGQRPGEIDLIQTFQNRKVGALDRMLQSANDLATREIRTTGTADLSKIRENFVQSNDARMKAFESIRKDIDALESAGIPRNQALAAMNGRISDDDIRQIDAGKYVRREPGNVSLRNLSTRPNFDTRLEALREARDSYPEVQDFTLENERVR